MNISVVGILIILVIVLFFLRGWKNGLVKSVFDLFSFLIVGLLTWMLYPAVSGFLIKTELYTVINGWMIDSLNNSNFLQLTIPDFFESLPAFIKESVILTSESALQSSIASIADKLTLLAINAISVIGLFIILSILAFFIKKMGSFINNIIIVGTINKILGGFFGFIQGLFICYIIIMLISYFPTSKLYNYVAEDMSKSYICNVMYNENVSILGFKPTYPITRGE